MTNSQPHHAGPPEHERAAFIEHTLAGFASRCLRWGLPMCMVCLLATAWHWSRPGSYSLGAPFMQAAGLLAAAALLLHLPAFWLQRAWLRSWLHTGLQAGQTLTVGAIALRLYLINLGLAVVLSVLLWQPLLKLLFFHRLYPVAFWLLPWQVLLGWLLGRWLQSETGALPAEVPRPE